MNEKQIIEYYKSVLTPINILEELNQMIYDFHNICSLVKFPYVTDGGVRVFLQLFYAFQYFSL